MSVGAAFQLAKRLRKTGPRIAEIVNEPNLMLVSDRIASKPGPHQPSLNGWSRDDNPANYLYAGPDESTADFHARLRKIAVEADVSVIFTGPSPATLRRLAAKRQRHINIDDIDDIG